MNERIKELAVQAANEIADQFKPGFFDNRMVEDVANIIYKHHEQFAQLIVQKCINKIETYRIPVGNSPAGELACGWTYDALKEIRDEIKEHFGVEE